MEITNKENSLVFNLKLGEYYQYWFKYILLSFVTLGVYYFSATNQLRKLITGSYSLGGINFEYTGKTFELFMGFIVIFAVRYFPYFYLEFYNPFWDGFFTYALINPYALIEASSDTNTLIYLVIAALTFIMGLFLPTICYFLFLRYRAEKTRWNGYCGKIKGSVFAYTFLWWGIILSILSLNLLSPYFTLKRKKYVWEKTFIGGKNFYFDETSAFDLMKVNIITTILFIPTLGISRIWYYAAIDRYIYSKLKFENLTFVSTVQGNEYFALAIPNLLLFVVSCGLALPYITKRTIDFYCHNHNIVGDVKHLALVKNEHELEVNDYGFFNYSFNDHCYFNFGWY